MTTATRKPRTIVSVTPYRRQVDAAQRCKVEVEDSAGVRETVALASLTRPEMARAARALYPTVTPGNAWLRFDSPALRQIILDNDARTAQAAVDQKLAGGSYERSEKVQEAAATGTIEEAVEGRLGGSEKTAGERLDEILSGLSAAVDRDQVEEIVRDEVKLQLSQQEPSRIVITLPDRDFAVPDVSHVILPKVIAAAALGLNVFLVGPAGSGKSTLAHQTADALGIPFYALSLGPTTPTSKLFGYMDAQGHYVRTPFREAYEHGGVILLDELDNGHPGLVAEINQATANGYCAFADGMVQRHPDCRIFATGNTFGRGPDRLFVGRNILDAATLDRFTTMEVEVDEKLERTLALAYESPEAARWVDHVQAVRRKAQDQKLPVVVSPRASIDGCKLLASGAFTWDEVEEIRLFAGIETAVRSKLR